MLPILVCKIEVAIDNNPEPELAELNAEVTGISVGKRTLNRHDASDGRFNVNATVNAEFSPTVVVVSALVKVGDVKIAKSVTYALSVPD